MKLEEVERISLPCAVILSAELKRWTLLGRFVPKLIGLSRWNRRVRSLLISLGTLAHLGIPKKRYRNVNDDPRPDQVVLVELTSSSSADGEKVRRLQDDFHALISVFKPQQFISRALLEAAANVIEHAYADKSCGETMLDPRQRWYATASFDPNNKSLRFFIYDHGRGIPESLRAEQSWLEAIMSLRSFVGVGPNDSEMIDTAVDIGRTRTGKNERGKGLRDIVNVVERTGAGYVRIISGKGDYRRFFDGKVEKAQHGSHIGGTMIEWSIPINAISS
ncbi:MAG TPA: hypothetical protein PKH39_19705 [Woeseiaceae bacterium]|nr:hypothetical protein [Woeseiaceae bacterium]